MVDTATLLMMMNALCCVKMIGGGDREKETIFDDVVRN
jgi:hypothetical protein